MSLAEMKATIEMPTEPRYWFPAKRFGWGWGLPSAWQEWVVLAVFFGLLAIGFVLEPPHRNLPAFLAWMGMLTGFLLACCWIKGEPPKWRWGQR